MLHLHIKKCYTKKKKKKKKNLGKSKKGGGTYFRCGYYSIEKDARRTRKPESMTVADVESRYNRMGSHYNLVFDNCSHWSWQLWHELLD